MSSQVTFIDLSTYAEAEAFIYGGPPEEIKYFYSYRDVIHFYTSDTIQLSKFEINNLSALNDIYGCMYFSFTFFVFSIGFS